MFFGFNLAMALNLNHLKANFFNNILWFLNHKNCVEPGVSTD